MTHAGTITVGVDIDGGDLGAKLAAEVRKSLAPMLADIQAQMAKTNKSLTGLDGAGLGNIAAEAEKAAKATESVAKSTETAAKATDKAAKSAESAAASTKKQTQNVDQLAASTQRVTQAEKEFAAAVDLFGKKSPQAESAYKRLTSAQSKHSSELIRASAESKVSTDSQIRDYDRLARAAEESAARQAAAAKAAGVGGGGGGSRGGGGFGGGGGRGGSRFLSPGMLNLGALGAAGLPAAAGVVTNLTGAVQALGQAGLAIPGIFAGLASSVGTAVIGFHGMKDAITALNDAASDPKKLKDVEKALKDMDPAAIAVAKSISTLTQGPLKDLQKQVAGNMFVDVDKSIDDLAGKSLPTLQKGLGGIGTAWNNTFKELGRVGGLDSTQSFLDRIFGNTADAQNRANGVIAPLTHAFGQLAATGSDFLPRLGDGLTKLGTRFDAFITKADSDGRLTKWIDEGFDAVSNLGTAFLNVGKIITDLTGAAGGDGGFLKWLADVTGQLHTFLSSADGQNKLKAFFVEGKKSLDQWMSTLGSLLPLAQQVIQGFQQWGNILLPIIKSIADGLTGLGGDSGLIAGIVTAFVGWKSISGIAGLLTGLGQVESKLGGLGGKATGAVSGLNKAFAGLSIGALAFGVGGNLVGSPGASGGDQALGAASNIGGGAVAGALVGGPWGAAIGALIGAGLTLFESATRQLNEGKAEWEKKFDEDLKDPDHQAQQKAKDDNALKPLLAAPSIPDSLIPKIQAGALPGFSIGPDGKIIGPDGQPINGLPANLTTPPPLPPPPGPPPPPSFTTGVPAQVNIDQQTIDKTKTALNEIRDQVAQGFNGAITLTDPTPAIIDRLRDLGVKITQLPDGKFTVDPIGLDDAVSKAANLNGQLGQFAGKTFTARVAVNGHLPVPNAIAGPPPRNSISPGRAGGGVFPGYAPGVDSIWAKVSPGEGVLIPEATRALGGGAGIYAINSMFRSGLSRQGYGHGGVIPGFADGGLGVDLTTGQGTGAIPGPTPDNSVIGLLSQIRDLLAGKSSGTSGNPLAQTADGVQSLVSANGTTGTGTGSGTGTKIGPFGTPLKKRGDPAYEMAAAAIQALGGDPEKFLGTDPTLTTVAAGGTATGAGSAGIAAALKAFAGSGSTDALAGTGLSVADPVVKALITARGKKKGGLSDDAIGGLVDQIVGGPGFSGTVDSSNSALIGSLTTFQKKLLKGQGFTTTTAATTAAAGATLPTDGSTPVASTDLSGTVPAAVSGTQSVFVTNWPGQAATGQNGQPALGPDGTPIVGTAHGTNTGAAAGQGGATNFPGKSILDAAFSSAGSTASDVAGSLIGAVASGTDFKTGTPTKPNADLSQLVKERNPLALASAFGLNVPDFTRQGGGGGDIEKNDGPGFDSKGRMFSDTGSLIDRTMTDLQAELSAKLDQQKEILNQIKDRVAEEALKPIVAAAVTEGIGALGNQVTNKIGQSFGDSAAPPIADAVAKAIPTGSGSPDGGDIAGIVQGAGGSLTGALFDEGGVMPTGSLGVNMSGSPERVLSPSQTRLFDSGLLGGWNMQPQQQNFATVSGVSGNDTVGADFFGVSQVPIIGAIVNAIIKTLLQLIGVNIESRDTLDEMSDSVRQFRGDFQKFDATGRLFNDTSGLVDRTGSSEQEAADERIRILKTVIEGIINFIIQKIIIPIGKAVADAAIQAGGAAAGAAINTQAPGAGGIVSALISGAGTAGVDIAGDLIGEFASSITPVIIDLISEGLQTLFPDLLTSVFSGGLIEQLLIGPITSIFQGIFGPLLGSVAGGIFAPFTALLGALSFDDGGVANGVGVMPKATIAPERVLSPRQTTAFEQLVSSLDRGASTSTSRTVQIGEMHLHGQAAPQQAHDKLLALLGA